MLSEVIDSLAYSPCQQVITNFGSDIDLIATMPIMSGNANYPKHAPRHWVVLNSGGGALSYKDHFGNTLTAVDLTQCVGIYLPAGPTILATGTTITKLLVVW